MTFPADRPTLLGTILTARGLRLLGRAQLPCTAVEVRADALLAEGVTPEALTAALRARRHPVLLTLRIPAEGGCRPWRTAERRDLYLRLLPEVEAIDIELATAGAMAPVLAAARTAGKTVVLSAHALARPATEAEFARWEKAFLPAARTIYKVAAQIKSWRDLQRLAALLVNHPELEVAAMGLGPEAAKSRAVLAALGSRLAYGWLDVPAAPGQPSAAALGKLLAVG